MQELRARLQRRGPKLIAEKKVACRTAEDALGVEMIRRSEVRRNDDRAEGRQRLEGELIGVEFEGRSIPLTLINLSRGGAMLEGDIQLGLFSEVVLVLPGEHRVRCIVRWLKGDRMGLEFEDGTHLQLSRVERGDLVRGVIAKTFPGFDLTQLETPRQQPSPPDRAPRRVLSWAATLIYGFRSTPVRLRNISSSGALIEAETQMPQGTEVVLDLGAAGMIDSTIVWSFCDQLGLRFATPFNLAAMGRAMPQVAAAGEGGSVDLDQLPREELLRVLDGFMKH